eukprot:318036_1
MCNIMEDINWPNTSNKQHMTKGQITWIIQVCIEQFDRDETKNKDIKLLLKIFDNILKHPRDSKYQNLNRNRICNKLTIQSKFILYVVGFYKSHDEKRLLFDANKHDQLKLTNALLLEYAQTPQVQKDYQSDQPQGSLHILHEMGFHKNQSENALQLFNFDVVKAIEHLYNKTKKCNGSILECCVVTELYEQITRKNVAHAGSLEVLNNFLHLLTKHNSVDDFQVIYNRFQGESCDIYKCRRFLRHYPIKNCNSHNECNFHQQILDKVHCYYMHTYNIGHRLTSKEKLHLSDTDQKQNYNNVMRHFKLLQNKFKKLKITNKYLDNRSKKFNLMRDIENTNMDYQEFSFGVLFDYNTFTNIEYILIKPLYSSLKEELLNNDIVQIQISEFNNEHNKAMIHFNSYYRKRHHPTLTLTYLLSLMFYCNYDLLQYEFSKTYRDTLEKHNRFYHLGKNLTEAV